MPSTNRLIMSSSFTRTNSEFVSVSQIRALSIGPLTSKGFHITSLNNETQTKLAALAAQILEDPVALKRLSEHVLTKIHLDIKRRHERYGYSDLW